MPHPDGVHTVVYPVHDLDDAALDRLARSIASFRATGVPVLICLQDTSAAGPLEPRIRPRAAHRRIRS
jgi:hypothetical protein